MKGKNARRLKGAPLGRRIAFWGFAFGAGLAISLAFYRPLDLKPEGIDASRYESITFADLSSFTYIPPRKKGPPPATDSIPRAIRELNGRRVSLFGYMRPLYVQEGKVSEFYLSSGGMSCCYADAPRITGIAQVTLPRKRAIAAAEMVRVWGTLEVREELDEAGIALPLYRVSGDVALPSSAGATTPGQLALHTCLTGLFVAMVTAFVFKVVLPWWKSTVIGTRASYLR